MAIRSRRARATVVLGAALGLAVIAVVLGASHDQDEPPGPPGGVGVGPTRGASVAMPRGLIGLTITLGLEDTQRTAWDGEVTVSEGRVISLDVERAAVGASIDGSKFRV